MACRATGWTSEAVSSGREGGQDRGCQSHAHSHKVLGPPILSIKCFLGDVQADMVELQGGLVGWRIERLVQAGAGGHSVAVRMGPFFRLVLEIPGDSPVSGVLELTQPGMALPFSAYHDSLRPAMREACSQDRCADGQMRHDLTQSSLLQERRQPGRSATGAW